MSKTCFVVGPIGSEDSADRIHADWLLEMIVGPALNEIGGFEISRADLINAPGQIDAQVIRHLLEDDLVIADLSLSNPNAFYEVGIRHMIQKPIVHMQLSTERIPFDVSIYRAIKFSLIRPADVRRAVQELKKQVIAIFDASYEVENPITLARGRVNFEARASSDEKVLMSEIRSLAARIESLERDTNSSKDNKLLEFMSERISGIRQLTNVFTLVVPDIKSKDENIAKFRIEMEKVGDIIRLDKIDGGSLLIYIKLGPFSDRNDVNIAALKSFGSGVRIHEA